MKGSRLCRRVRVKKMIIIGHLKLAVDTCLWAQGQLGRP